MKPDQPKLCECGCGQPAPIATKTDAARGYVAGEPRRFVAGHHGRALRLVLAPPNPSGLCECGCGEKTAISKVGDSRTGNVAGEHVRFVHGHMPRALKKGKPRTAEERRKMSLGQGGTGEPTVRTIHSTLAREHPKTGVCEECGRRGKTHYAFQRHPEPHTMDRADYRELCASCHHKFDAWLWPKRRFPTVQAGTGKVPSPASLPTSAPPMASEP